MRICWQCWTGEHPGCSGTCPCRGCNVCTNCDGCYCGEDDY